MAAEMEAAATRRRLSAVFAFSLALHGTLLFSGISGIRPNQVQVPAALAPLQAHLRQAVPAGSPLTTSGSLLSPLPLPAAIFPQARQLPPRRVQRENRVVGEAAASPVSASSPEIEVTSPAPASVPAPPLALPQGKLLAAYRQRLAELFAGQRTYPRLAVVRGWEGEVLLRLRVARQGKLLAVHLDQSSGFEVLDLHALALLEGFASLPPLPEGLEASEIQVVVPVSYKLRKTT